MSKRAVLYARVSQDTQRDNYSIPTQIAACAQYAKENGYRLVGAQYVDAETGKDARPGPGTICAYADDHSGTELLRPGVLAMLDFLREQGADAVIVLSLDRLARDPYIRMTLEREIQDTGARVIYVQGSYSDTPEGEIHKDLDAAFAKWENLKRVERSKRGKVGKAQRGLFPAGSAPYGYEIDKTAPGGLKVNPSESAVVKRIFTLYDEGNTLRSIARRLNAEGIPSPRGARWSNATLHVILRNETYAGRAVYNKTMTFTVGDGITKPKRYRQAKRKREEIIDIPVTAIVDGVLFERVQARLSHNREAIRRRPRRFYLLSGMVFCERCGKRYTVQTETARRNCTKEIRSYRHRQEDGHCSDHMISARKLEEPVWQGIVNILLDPVKLATGYELSLAEQRARLAHATEHLETLRQSVAKLDKRKRSFQIMYADGDITRAEYLDMCAEVDRERNTLTGQIAELERELANVPTESELADLQAFTDAIGSYLAQDDIPGEERRAILEKMQVKVFIGADHTKATVTGIFQPFDFCLSSNTCSHIRRLPVTFTIPLTYPRA